MTTRLGFPKSRLRKATTLRLDARSESGYNLPRMGYEVVIARSAQDQFGRLGARWRSALKRALQTHLEYEPKVVSKSRIKRLRGLRQPQYRLRVGEFRVYYDVDDSSRRVEVLGFVRKADAEEWLGEHGVPE